MFLSVIIPYFNDAENIKASVLSALAQTYKNMEIIIIDDENSINSKKTLSQIIKLDNKIKIIRNKKKLGVSAARNKGINFSKGNLIAFLDSDDLWKKNKISLQIKFIKKYNADICYTNYSGIINKRLIYKINSPKTVTYESLLRECPICCSSVVVKKKIFKTIKFKNLKTKEDYMLWLDFAKKGYKFIGLNKFLSFYRVRNNSLSSLHLNKIFSAFKIYSHYLNYNFLLSIFFILRLYLNAFKKKYI
jgi:teichuronic acid biosynthesis glycosyltransferase TuaG